MASYSQKESSDQDGAATVDDLRRQFAELKSDVAGLADTLGQIADGEVDGAVRRARAGADELTGRVRKFARRTQGQAEHALSDTRHFVAKRPIASAAIALAVGFALGAAMRRR